MPQRSNSKIERLMLKSKMLKKFGALVLFALLGSASLGYSFAQSEPAEDPAESSDSDEVSVYEQAQGLWQQCAEKQKASAAETVEADYRLCNAVYNALGKAIGSNAYGGEDVKWLYFYMGRTSASMTLVALSVADAGVSQSACASVERSDWAFQKVAAKDDSWEAEVIAQYKIEGLVKTCRGKFGLPQWRQK